MKMYAIYEKNRDEERLLAKVATKEEAEALKHTIDKWADETYELMGHADFEEYYGEPEYVIEEVA